MRALELKGLPANTDAERFVLGSLLLDGDRWPELDLSLDSADFSLVPNQCIWRASAELAKQGIRIDRVTVAEQLKREGQLEQVGGVSYLIDLDSDMPHVPSLEGYCTILRECRIRRDAVCLFRSMEERVILGADSATDLLGRAETMVRALGMQTVRSEAFLSTVDIIQAAGGVEQYLAPEKNLGIPTGFEALDEMTGGMSPGEFWVIAAETGGGKSTFASHIAQNMARAGFPGVIASLEMTAKEVTDGLICRAGSINTQSLRRGGDMRQIRWAAGQVSTLPLYILDRPGLTLPKLHAELRRMRAERGITFAVVDYIQLMQIVGRYARRDLEIGSLTRGLKLMAMELNIGIIGISQLSRPADKVLKRRPELADLKESSSIEQDANAVLMLWGEYQPEKMRYYPWGLLIRKRRGGPVGMIPMLWEKATGTFLEAKGNE